MTTSRLTAASALLAAGAALLLAACASPGESPSTSPKSTASSSATAPSPSAEPSADPTAFTVTSADFGDGEELADAATASAFGGQCAGDNLNPALAWSNAPQGTVSFAIIMTDESASGWVHWVHADIPGDVTSVGPGESTTLAGAAGRNWGNSEGYFGPCPPGPDHRYVFTVYALDAALGLEPGFTYYDLLPAMADHVLAETQITGMRSGPA